MSARRRRVLLGVPSEAHVGRTRIRAQEGQNDEALSQRKGERAELSAHSRFDQVSLCPAPIFLKFEPCLTVGSRHANIIAYKEAFFEEST